MKISGGSEGPPPQTERAKKAAAAEAKEKIPRKRNFD